MADFQADLQAISAALTNHSLGDTLTNLVQGAMNAARSRGGSLYLLDESGTHLKPRVIVGLPEEYIAACGDIPVGTQCCGMAVAHRKPWFVEDMLADPLFSGVGDNCAAAGFRSAFSVPVIDASGEIYGSLACQFPEVRKPSEYEIERNHVFATLIAFALMKEKKPVAA
jgi:putative methionine-R-sulfoxide reductase with GAF domain